MQHDERFLRAEQVARLGIWGNLGLAVIKLFAGILGRSQAVVADAINTLADIVTDLVTMVSLKVAKKPVDIEHPYGHGKAEAIAAAFIGFFVIGTGIYIFFSAIRSIFAHLYVKPELIASLAALLTILAKEGMFRYVYKVGKELSSPVIMAKARDHRSDVLASTSVLVGVFAAMLGYPIFDPIAAGVVSLFIVRMGYHIILNSFHELMDTAPPQEVIKEIDNIAAGIKGVEHVHEVKARHMGQFLLVDLKLDIDPKITVVESHAIAGEVKHKIIKEMQNVADVMVHVNPHLH